MRGEKDIKEQVEALQSQAKNVMNDTAVPVDERIQKAADIYRQAEKLADESVMDDKKRESLLSDSSRFYYDYGMYKGIVKICPFNCSTRSLIWTGSP